MNLNVGCGIDERGDVRIDISVKVLPDIVADVYHLPFRCKMFDDVYMLSVLEHLENPRLCLETLKMYFKGYLVIIVPNVYYWDRILRTIKRGFEIPVRYKASHLQVWDMITLKQLLRRCGLRMVSGRFNIFDKNFMVIIEEIKK